MSKILCVDIEWSPAKAYVWRMFDENISPAQLIDPGGLLCFCAHWIGSKEFMFYSEWDDGKAKMAEVLRDLLDEADAVVGYNSDRYDIPKIRGHLMLEGLKPFAPLTSIDLIKTVKKFGFVMNRLAYIAPLLGVGDKMKNSGFQLWRDVIEGDPKAQRTMRRYCIQDVRVTAALYKKVLPFINNHPHLGDDKGECGACNSKNVQSRGWRRTKFFKVRRIQCQDCGSWSEGTRIKI
jgi:RNase_H superfamily